MFVQLPRRAYGGEVTIEPAGASSAGNPSGGSGADLSKVEIEGMFEKRLAEAFAALGCFNLAVFGKTGVGKSTLVNALVPEAFRAIGVVNAVTGRGRHTSTSAVAFPLEPHGWVVDTPGIRSFGLAHVDLDRFMRAFPDLAEGAHECPRGCTHEAGEGQHCALDDYVARGGADPTRLVSLRRLLASRTDSSGSSGSSG